MDNTKELFAAIGSGNTATVGTLLDAQPGLISVKNEQGQSPVLFAVYRGNTEMRDLLVGRGAKGYSPDGFPAFALAAVFGHLRVAQYLFERGAPVNAVATNGSGYNALTGAVASGHKEIAAWLLDAGADPNYRYGSGYSPLLTAAANGHLEIVKILLRHGADPRAQTNDGKTAEALAEERKHPEVAEFLHSRAVA